MSKPSADVFLNFVSKIIEENELANEAIQRVRELHEKRPLSNDDYLCIYDDEIYPCPTIEALDGDQNA